MTIVMPALIKTQNLFENAASIWSNNIWRIPFYGGWLTLAVFFGFAHHAVTVEFRPEAKLNTYLLNHLLYWLAWGGVSELVYRTLPVKYDFSSPGNKKLQAILFSGLTLSVFSYFSFYWWMINQEDFVDSKTFLSFVHMLTIDGISPAYYLKTTFTFALVISASVALKQSRYLKTQRETRQQLESTAKQLQAKLAESKLSVLKGQIHPHFLFNALNNIASLVESRDSENAYKAVTLLAKMLRLTFTYIRAPTITVNQELALVEAILEIGKLRFGDRLSWSINTDTKISTMPIPPFMVQPLVENSMRHGVEKTHSPVRIEIEIKRAAAGIWVQVSDNADSSSISGANGNSGVGLINLSERLTLMSKQDAKLHYGPRPEGGFRVIMLIPAMDRVNDE